MRLSLVLSKERNIDRNFARKWRYMRDIRVKNVTVTQKLQDEGRTVLDAVEAFKVPVEPEPEVKLKMERKYVPPVEVVRQSEPAFLYKGDKLVRDLQQAMALTNTVQVSNRLPTSITQLQGKYLLPNQTEMLESLIKDRTMFDAHQTRLPRYIDIKRLGYPQARRMGIPRDRMCNGLLYGLLDLCERLPVVCHSPTIRNIFHRPFISSYCRGSDGVHLVLRKSPDLLLTSSHPLPQLMSREQLLQQFSQTDELKLEPTVMAPLSPFLHIQQSQDYDDSDILPFPSDRPFQLQHAHTVFVAESGHLLHRIKPPRISALGFMSAYMTATAIARTQLLKSGMSVTDLEHHHQLEAPVTVQAVATDGRRISFSVLQLNTLRLAPNTHLPVESEFSQERVLQHATLMPNLLWCERPVPFYTACGYQQGRPELAGLNEAVFERFVALYLNELQLESRHDAQERQGDGDDEKSSAMAV